MLNAPGIGGEAPPVIKAFLEALVDDVAAEPVYPLIQIEAEYPLDLLHHFLVVEVEVGLAFRI